MAWSQANGVPLRMLASWCAHTERSRVQPEGKAPPRRVKQSAAAPMRPSSGFVTASPPMLGATPTVQVLLPSAGHAEGGPCQHSSFVSVVLPSAMGAVCALPRLGKASVDTSTPHRAARTGSRCSCCAGHR
jgi:hypothetical protein